MGYDVTLDLVDEHNGNARCTFLLRKDMYGEHEARQLAHSFQCLVKAFSKDPRLPLIQPDIFDPVQVEQVSQFSQGEHLNLRRSSNQEKADNALFSGAAWSSVWPETVVHRVDEVANCRPADIAVSCGDVAWTYLEMMQEASGIASILQTAGIRRGSPVAVLVEPTSLWVASLLGILRIGAVYLPLEPGTPPTHLTSIINDCQPGALLVDHRTKHYADTLGRVEALPIIDLSQFPRCQESPVPISATGTDLAVIMYTSGSSGSPKGISITHHNLMNLFEPISKLYGLGPDEVVLQQTTPTFDLSLLQLFMALTLGGSLCILPRHHRGDVGAITELIARRGVTITGATPTEYNAWLKNGKQQLTQCSRWRRAFAIGEPVPASLVHQFAAMRGHLSNLDLWNLYGPTETTIMATSMHIPLVNRGGSMSDSSDLSSTVGSVHTETAAAAGYPQPNYAVHVLDTQMRPVPVGVQGEIYIGGAGVARGYLNNGPLTTSRFVPDPFTSHNCRDDRAILHRTGDLGRWRPGDGALLVEGRMAGDTQIKLRGARLDVAAVEHALVAVGGDAVREAAVSLRRDDNLVELLVAHVVVQGGEEWQRSHGSGLEQVLRQGLAVRLPRYMCPAGIIRVHSLPRAISGKLDRKAVARLPIDSPEGLSVGDDVCARDGSENLESNQTTVETTETRLRHIWSGVLPDLQMSSRHITPNADFFHVGGSSLLLLRLQKSIREAWGVEMPLIKMFEESTLANMARWIDYGAGALPESKRQPDDIDWEREVSISRALKDINPGQQIHTDENAGKIVVLTGATGLVGGALLRALVAHPSINHVHCIAVRQPVRRRCQKLVESVAPLQGKVTLHEGDLDLPRLGLSERGAQLIFSAAHAIVHCAADMSMLKTYASLRAPNVQATKELAERCAMVGRMVPLHFVSSIASGRFAAEKNHSCEDGNDVAFVLRPDSVAGYQPSTSGAGKGAGLADSSSPVGYSYAASKWVSEVFLERLSACHPDWHISVHRPSFVVPETWDDTESPKSNGEPNSDSFNSLDLLSNLRHYFGLLGNMALDIPSGGVIRGGWNMVPVGAVVKGIMDAVLDDIAPEEKAAIPRQNDQVRQEARPVGDMGTAIGSKSFRILHHIGGVDIPTMALREWLEAQTKTNRDVEQKAADIADAQKPDCTSTEKGKKEQQVGLVEWAEAAGELGMHPTFVTMLESLAASNGAVTLPNVADQ